MTLNKANNALRNQKFGRAMWLYLDVLSQRPALAQFVLGNMALVKERFRASSGGSAVSAVASWSLGHNPVGRAHVLAQIYSGLAPVEIIGTFVPRHGSELWAPLRESAIHVRGILLERTEDFLPAALQLVAANPYRLVHLSKPRMPNIVLGLLYKLLWQSRVVVDMDDDEMAFFPAFERGPLAEQADWPDNLPESDDLVGPEWTQFAVACSGVFDGVTVANPALQERFGGSIVRHARSEEDFDPARYPKAAVRRLYNIGEDERVVLFLGTPRTHKGLLETAAALDALGQPNVTFLVVGAFPQDLAGLRDQLQAFPRLRCRFLPDQPFARVPELVALADICLALQDPSSAVSAAQVPAKLSDALAMGRLAIVSQNRALCDLALADHALVTNWNDLHDVLARALTSLPESADKQAARRAFFLQEFSLAANRQRLQGVLAELPAERNPGLSALMRRVLTHLSGFPLELLGLVKRA